jgi:hypothetical protein
MDLKKKTGVERGTVMLGRNWLDNDVVVLAVLLIGLGMVDLLALSF